MLRRLASAVAVTLVATVSSPLRAQLGLITVPRGSLRVDLVGGFYPNDQVWVDGTKRPLGSFFDGTNNSEIASLQSSLSSLLGQPVSSLSLGGITAVASRDHGVGNIGFAYGLSRRITIFGNIPIVYVRSHVATAFDPTTSRVGINPANARIGNGNGASAAFISQFDIALDTLRSRVQSNFYAGADLTLAQQSVATGTTMRAALNRLLIDPNYASAVLPLSTDPLTTQLIGKITALQSTLNGALALPTPFTALPDFPTTALTADDFNALLNEPTAIGLKSPNNLPVYGIGDMSAGIAFALLQDGSPGRGSWTAAWLRATASFPNATAANPGILLDQGTGTHNKSVQLDAIWESGRPAGGLRLEASYLHQLPADLLTRPTSPEEFIVPPSYLVAVTTQFGDSIAITARPWISFAPHLALSGSLQYWRRGASSTGYLTGQAAIPGVDPTLLDIGSAANAVVAGIGLSYFHDGHARDGTVSLPMEAGWSIERTLKSSAGIFPVALTTRVYLRIYRPLISH